MFTVQYNSASASLSDRYMHLTNYSVNKSSSSYTHNTDAGQCQGHKWTLKSLWGYLKVGLYVSSFIQICILLHTCSVLLQHWCSLKGEVILVQKQYLFFIYLYYVYIFFIQILFIGQLRYKNLIFRKFCNRKWCLVVNTFLFSRSII